MEVYKLKNNTELVIEDNTIYEIDSSCCVNINEKQGFYSILEKESNFTKKSNTSFIEKESYAGNNEDFDHFRKRNNTNNFNEILLTMLILKLKRR